MKMSKKLGLFTLTGALALGLVACGDEENKATPKKEENVKTYTFATGPDTPPFEYSEKGKLTGFDIELIEAIAEDENVEIKWKAMKFNGIVPALQSKQVDGAIAAMSITEDRKKVVDFTDPYFDSGLVLVVKKGSGIESLEDLKGKTVVTKTSSASATKAVELSKEYGFKVKNLEDEPTLYMDVQSGGSDALINDYPFVIKRLQAEGSTLEIIGEKLNVDQYGIAITKGNKEAYELFNEGLKELKENGEYDKLFEKYFGTNE